MPTAVKMSRRSPVSGWGFQLTGGVTFDMPLTVFELYAMYGGHTDFGFKHDELFDECTNAVQEGGRADEAGIRIGDVILEINGVPTTKLTLKEANAIVESNNTMDLLVTSLMDQEKGADGLTDEEKLEKEFEANRVNISDLDLVPPRAAPRPEQPQRKCWHPVVMDTNPPPIIEESTGDEEAPHKKILRNFRHAIAHKKHINPSPENPPNVRPPSPPPDDDINEAEIPMEEQLRMMQRQLAALCAVPAALQRSLAAVSEKINKLLPPEHVDEPESDFTDDEIEPDIDESFREHTPEPDTYSENITESNEDILEEEQEEEEPESESKSESEPEPILTPEEIERLEKLRKLEQLNRAWPWGDEVKPVYKISDRYKVMHSEKFVNTIQNMESKIVLRRASDVFE